jgi:hypothetical protein
MEDDDDGDDDGGGWEAEGAMQAAHSPSFTSRQGRALSRFVPESPYGAKAPARGLVRPPQEGKTRWPSS